MESRIDPSRNDEDRSIKERLDKLAEDIKKLPPDRIEKVEKLLKSMDKKAVSLKEAAGILGVSIDTVRRAIKAGTLRAFQLNRKGNWMVPLEEVEGFLKGEKSSQ